MKILKEIICIIFGHRSICLMRHTMINHYGEHHTTISGWVCERCGHQKSEQWDT